MLGMKDRPRSLKDLFISFKGNSHHLWMWDQYALQNEPEKAGFIKVRKCLYNDSADKMFQYAEDELRFINALAFKAIKA